MNHATTHLEAQVAHPAALTVVGADRHVQSVIRGYRRRVDRERSGEARVARLARRLCETRRERLVAERPTRGGIRDLQGLVTEAGDTRISDNLRVVAAGVRPAVLTIDRAGQVPLARIERDRVRADGVGRGYSAEEAE